MSGLGLQIRLLPYRLGTLFDSFITFFTLPLHLTFKSRLLRSFLCLLIPKIHPPLIKSRVRELLVRNKTLPPIVPPPIPKDLISRISIVEHLPSSLSASTGWKAWWIFTSDSTGPSSSSSTLTLYFPGGGYLNNMQPPHFLSLYELCSMTNAVILVVQYPLPPNARDIAVLDHLASLIKEVKGAKETSSFLPEVSKALDKCQERFAIAGDSAGGGLAYCLGLHLANKAKELPQPNEILAVAPWLDLSCSHPEQKRVNDPWLDTRFLKLAALEWLGLSSESTPLDPPPTQMFDPFASPYHANSAQLQAFDPKTRFTVVVGTNDLFYPEDRDFCKRLVEVLNVNDKPQNEDKLGSFENNRVAFRAWESMVHVFTLFPIVFKERDEARAFFARRLVGK